jgi:hypothetical protein
MSGAATVGLMSATWDPDAPGVLALPSGRLIRGRAVSLPLPEGPRPDFGLYLLGKLPPPGPWPFRWVRWPDFGLPADPEEAVRAFAETYGRSAAQRTEVGCAGGRGRTGTALACLAILDGVPAAEAVAYVRERYSPHAVETPAQRAFVERFSG